jgi:hypothetical protein
MNDRDAADAAGDSRELPAVDADGNEKRRKVRVIPFVEDRRNILVLTLDEPLDEPIALSLMFALERGIEAAFELEDSELHSELLPPNTGPRGRILFTEAAEGGAGILRQLQAEPTALAKAVEQALAICHFDAHGDDLGGPHADRPCGRACYECLLSYGNQRFHHALDRHAVRDLLLRLAAADVEPEQRGETRTDQFQRLIHQTAPTADAADVDGSIEHRFMTWLKERGLRLPTETRTLVTEANAQPDFVYRIPGVNLAVFLDGPDTEEDALRDLDAEERLFDARWDVVRFPHHGDWDAIAADHSRYFGTPHPRL